MQVAKKDGLPINKLCCQYEGSFKLTGFNGVFKSKKDLQLVTTRKCNFEKWFQEKLIPALPTSTLIVMDNTSYHRYLH